MGQEVPGRPKGAWSIYGGESLLTGTAWTAEQAEPWKVSPRDPQLLAGRDFKSEKWLDWFRSAASKRDVEAYVWVEDRDAVEWRVTRSRSGRRVRFEMAVPVGVFFAGEDPREVWRGVLYDLWVRAAAEAGWPAPPPMPPLHDPEEFKARAMQGPWRTHAQGREAEAAGRRLDKDDPFPS